MSGNVSSSKDLLLKAGLVVGGTLFGLSPLIKEKMEENDSPQNTHIEKTVQQEQKTVLDDVGDVFQKVSR